MNNKKKIECFYLDRFFELLSEAPKNVQAGEAPDFIVEYQGSKIGIEVTEFHSGLKGAQGWPRRLVEEAWESLQQEIMEEVGKHEELKNTNGLLFFENLELPPKSLYKDFVGELVQLSLGMLKSGHREVTLGNHYPLLRRYLKKFYFEQVNCYITWEWNHIASFIGLSESELINVAKPKIDKATDYRKSHIEKLWLIIVSGVKLSRQCRSIWLTN